MLLKSSDPLNQQPDLVFSDQVVWGWLENYIQVDQEVFELYLYVKVEIKDTNESLPDKFSISSSFISFSS